MTMAYMAFHHGEWQSAVTLAMAAGTTANFSEEGPELAARAAVAGNLPEELERAIAASRESPYQGTGISAAIAASEGAQAAWLGRGDEARALYRGAFEMEQRTGDLLGAAILGLEWGALAGDQDPEAASAAAYGEAFLTEHGAAITVQRYRAAFVRPQQVPVEARRSTRSAAKVPSA